jgi:hypothetical protein
VKKENAMIELTAERGLPMGEFLCERKRAVRAEGPSIGEIIVDGKRLSE